MTRTKLYWVRKHDLFWVCGVSVTAIDAQLSSRIRQFPVGTFKAIGNQIYTTRADFAATLPAILADRAAKNLDASIELI